MYRYDDDETNFTSFNDENYFAEINNDEQKTNNFIEPKICDEVPILSNYCDKDLRNYHCNHLYRIMFRAANYKNYNDDPIFNLITNSSHDELWETTYHIKNLMEHKENPVTIYNTVSQFNNVCVD